MLHPNPCAVRHGPIRLFRRSWTGISIRTSFSQPTPGVDQADYANATRASAPPLIRWFIRFRRVLYNPMHYGSCTRGVIQPFPSSGGLYVIRTRRLQLRALCLQPWKMRKVRYLALMSHLLTARRSEDWPPLCASTSSTDSTPR